MTEKITDTCEHDLYGYKRKIVDAIAHDLKSPMAAISACAEILSDNISSDKKEYYANKIEEKVAQIDKILNHYLEFSNTDNLDPNINIENIDIGDVIEKIIVDNEHVISERSLKINIDDSIITIQTDLRLFHQAIFNLIENAVLYSKEGTDIDISFDEKSIVISNIPAEKVDDPDELKQPFVKGSAERGTPGSGLGLAISENNLAILGYKLEIKSNDGRFVAKVCKFR